MSGTGACLRDGNAGLKTRVPKNAQWQFIACAGRFDRIRELRDTAGRSADMEPTVLSNIGSTETPAISNWLPVLVPVLLVFVAAWVTMARSGVTGCGTGRSKPTTE